MMIYVMYGNTWKPMERGGHLIPIFRTRSSLHSLRKDSRKASSSSWMALSKLYQIYYRIMMISNIKICYDQGGHGLWKQGKCRIEM